MQKRVETITESSTGRNTRFHDNLTGLDMTRKQFVDRIKRGEYEGYHIRNINGIETPVSNPDKKESNNLG